MVVPESELVHVLLKVLPTDTMMRPIDRPFELAPKAFDGVRVDIATDVFLTPVVDLAVPDKRRRKWRPITQAEQVHMCGNSVSPPVACALVKGNNPELVLSS